ncbi:hypothetical protein like AT2G34930 [Hibiscus trionum]|uniref:Leucine-rich repeat-containing N-terminal plant-type domain-containing protein n=1 Tax=Hibiscus trionum TaxID=183268 RepID=A0A9W7LWJ8_HIBTR|nr:hypothetical protein like AT2G34930 [Hibiscus trionum]
MTIVTIPLFPFLLLIAIAATICFSCCYTNSNVNVVCIESEREALLKLKNDLTDPSNRLSSWVEGGDCCKWNGVVCHNITGHVHQLHLAAPPPPPPDDYFASLAERDAYYRSKLGGRVNPSLLQLKHLTSLDLSNNNFSSIQIPEFLGLLGSLTYLNLSRALFKGAVPHNLGNLSKLQYLDLRCEVFQFLGLGPSYMEARSLEWVSGLSSLQYLDLSGVDLHKASDWLQVTFNIPSLIELHLSGCGLAADPSPISNVNSTKSLAVLDLSLNQFFSLPMSIFSLHGLVSIDLSSNSLRGPVPDYFGNMSFLEVVDLSSNSLDSSIPNSLYSLNRLQFLSLGNNNFQGEISSAIGNLSSLTHLDLSVNMLEGRLPSSLEHLVKLKELDVSGCKLEGPIPDYLGNMSFIQVVDLSYNKFRGRLPTSLEHLVKLEELDVSGCKLEGPIPDYLGNMSFLQVVDLSYNKLQGRLPTSLEHLCNLKEIDLSSNQIEGDISEILRTLSSCSLGCLESLCMADNKLSGRLTDRLGQFKNLVHLSLAGNTISGPIPLSIGESSLMFQEIN